VHADRFDYEVCAGSSVERRRANDTNRGVVPPPSDAVGVSLRRPAARPMDVGTGASYVVDEDAVEVRVQS
jgi:hypothetical protein